MGVSPDSLRRIRRHIAHLGAGDDRVAFRAERHLIWYGGRAIGPLIEATASSDPQVRFRAAWALGKSRDPDAFAALCALVGDEDERVWYDAMLALGELGDERAVPVLARWVPAAATEPVRASAAASALQRLGPVALPTLTEIARGSSPEARNLAADAIALINGGPDAIE